MSLLITCPVCGRRDGYEFRYGGEDKGPYPHGETIPPGQWVQHVHMNSCAAGIQKEWWFHRDGCGSWFAIFRDTVKNREASDPGAIS